MHHLRRMERQGGLAHGQMVGLWLKDSIYYHLAIKFDWTPLNIVYSAVRTRS